MKELAQEENVPVLHMTEKTTELYNQLGPEESKDLFMWLEEDESLIIQKAYKTAHIFVKQEQPR